MCKLAKIVSTLSFQAPSSQNHAPFKSAQACSKLNFFLWVTLSSRNLESMNKAFASYFVGPPLNYGPTGRLRIPG